MLDLQLGQGLRGLRSAVRILSCPVRAALVTWGALALGCSAPTALDAGAQGASDAAQTASFDAAIVDASSVDSGAPSPTDASTQPAPLDAGPPAPHDAAVKLVPAQGALLGHYYGDGTVAATDQRIGRTPPVHLTYFAWADDWTGHDVPAQDLADGRIPLVNWEPVSVDFADIVSGALDATIEARARGAKALGAQFFLDFAAEMNGDEGWGGNNPTLYVAAWRHIHDIFVAQGASNVVWVWCPNVTDVDGSNAHTMAYYPGDAYVDWTCVDGYNWGATPGFAWQTFKDVFADIYPLLAAKGKPIMIGEMASDETGGVKATWIDAIVPTLRTAYPAIRAFVWFDVHKERHWEVNSSPASLEAYQRLARDPYLNP